MPAGTRLECLVKGNGELIRMGGSCTDGAVKVTVTNDRWKMTEGQNIKLLKFATS